MEFTHEEILKLIKDRKGQVHSRHIAKHIGISEQYFCDALQQRVIVSKKTGRKYTRKIDPKHFPAIVDYLNSLSIKLFVGKVADEVLR